jgi:hypothetical protein
MNKIVADFTSTQDQTLIDDVPDEALEAAASSAFAGNFTLGSCTGLSECPA